MHDSVENLVTLLEHGTLNQQQLIQGLRAALAPIRAVAHAHAGTSTTAIFRGEELYFRDPDGIRGQVSGMEYRGQRKIP